MKVSKRNILLAVLSIAFSASAQVPPRAQQPNIIFILADDLGYGDVGCYGSALIKTPHIDALAKNGMRFTQFYAGSTVCAPSRASLMTGKHTGHNLIRGNGEIPLPETDSILPQFLHQAGYRNGMVGKWGLGVAGTSGAPEKKGWDFFSGLLHHVEGHYQHPDSAWQLLDQRSQKIPIPRGKYSNEWFTEEAIRFIDLKPQSPFFLYLSFTLPHAELSVPDTFLKAYLNKEGSSTFSPEIAHASGQHYGQQPYPKAAYAAMVSQMDDYIGRLMRHLQKQKIDQNTIIIFTSDNGTHTEGGRTKKDVAYFQSSGPLRGIKRDLYEGGIREPFIVSWNGKIKSGSTNIHTAALWDMLPTICEAAGLKTMIGTDGISLLPTLLGKQQKQHESLYWEFYEGGFKQAVRKDNWKAIRFYKGATPVRTELYNLASDIGETNNISMQYPAVVSMMESIMDKEHIQSTHPQFQIK